MNFQEHLQTSKGLEEAFANEVNNAKNAEVKSFYQKLSSEQRTISNQLQSKVNMHGSESQNQQTYTQDATRVHDNTDQTNA
jgi:predicted outer membrane protein